MTVTSPQTVARLKLMSVLTTEFAVEAFPVKADRLHRSLGRDKTVIGVSPVSEIPLSNNNNVINSLLLVQFYGKWKDDVIDPTMAVDPTTIETYAERFKRALRGNDPATDYVWYFKLREIQYPPDPTGNITRFEARVEAFGDNATHLLETV